jgi:hypothetical protein
MQCLLKKTPVRVARFIDEQTLGIYEEGQLIRVGQNLQSIENWLDWFDMSEAQAALTVGNKKGH